MSEYEQFLTFIARFGLVLLFPFSALNKIFDYPSAMAQAAHGWIPLAPSAATVLLVLGGTLELVGPLCILFGFYRCLHWLCFCCACHGSPVSGRSLTLFLLRVCLPYSARWVGSWRSWSWSWSTW